MTAARTPEKNVAVVITNMARLIFLDLKQVSELDMFINVYQTKWRKEAIM